MKNLYDVPKITSVAMLGGKKRIPIQELRWCRHVCLEVVSKTPNFCIPHNSDILMWVENSDNFQSLRQQTKLEK
jgi:hypothetical protein